MNNKQAALNWAVRVYHGQDASRARTPHMFYDGDTIYSYGYHFPIARYHEAQRVTLFTSCSYSVTTAKHKSHVACAIEGERFTVPDVQITRYHDQGHAANVAYLASEVQRIEKCMLRARESNLETHAEEAKDARAALASYAATFDVVAPLVPHDERVTLRLIRARLLST